ncbi:Hypothetical predicted protein [Octopus vulgaris]|uniref:Uncharacterized protein n=1 Tax=Octopus vulgaris TaxID=6645 RepID=A0AA36AVI8_OCTVU|nr:Hypothetical predicted protein [Octopus vulgaris]
MDTDESREDYLRLLSTMIGMKDPRILDKLVNNLKEKREFCLLLTKPSTIPKSADGKATQFRMFFRSYPADTSFNEKLLTSKRIDNITEGGVQREATGGELTQLQVASETSAIDMRLYMCSAALRHTIQTQVKCRFDNLLSCWETMMTVEGIVSGL